MKQEKKYLNSQAEELIAEYIHSERDRAILRRRLIDGIGFEKLGEEFGLTDRRIKTIVYRCEKELFENIEPLQ